MSYTIKWSSFINDLTLSLVNTRLQEKKTLIRSQLGVSQACVRQYLCTWFRSLPFFRCRTNRGNWKFENLVLPWQLLMSLIPEQFFVNFSIVKAVITFNSYKPIEYIKRKVFKVAISIQCWLPAPSLLHNYRTRNLDSLIRKINAAHKYEVKHRS